MYECRFDVYKHVCISYCCFLILLVSTDLVHSTLTSPGLLDSPTFLPDFTMPSLITQTDSSTAPPPHIALLTSSGNHGNNNFLSTSPSLNVPTVCIENPENEMVCMNWGLKNDRDSTLKAKDLKELPDVSMSSGEEEDEENTERVFISSPLSSKSAPDLQRAHTISVHSTRKEEEKSPRSHSITDPLYTTESNEVMIGVKEEDGEEEEEEEENLYLTTKSEVCIINPVSSPVTRSTTVSGTHSHKGRTHQKSFSLSGIQYCKEEEEDDNKLSTNVYDHDSRSRGSSFISNSSKVESSTDDEDDDQFHTASEADLKSKSSTSLLTHSNTSLGLFPIQTEKISQSEEEMLSSEEDLLDGEVQIPSRQGRRHSDVKITNIDDFNSGSEEDESKRGLPRSSTVEQHLTSHDLISHDQKEQKELTPNTKDDDLALSDIDVKIDSSNSSYCGTLLELGITPIGNGVPPTSHRGSLPVQSSSPRTSPRLSDPKSTIKQLQNIIRSESPVFSQTNFSDDSDHEGKERRKAITLPSQSPVGFRRSPIPSSPDLSKQHHKVARNFSSASDTKVMLHNKTMPVLKTSESSSLDFVQLKDGKGSPRSPRSPRQSHPSMESTPPSVPSQLFFAKSSPKVSPTRVLDDDSYSQRSPNRLVGSPLEKRVSKSADNLFSETGTDDSNTRETKEQSPSKKKSKEDTSVKLIRFEPLPQDMNNSSEEGAKGVRKDLKAYYGIPVQQEGKEHKKGLSKLFRRDSKKEKRTKKSESTTSFESLTSEPPIKEKTKPTPVVYTSPEGRKPRSRTIHGDYNLENVFIDESQVPVPSKNPKQLHFQEVISPVEEDPSIIQNSVSPSTKSEFVFETENEKSDLSSLSIKLDEYPELMSSEETDVSWYRTIDRRLRRSMNKHEKGRQGVMFDWINTERHMHRAFIILKVVFRDKLISEVSLSEDILNHLFPSLDELFEVSKNFSLELQKRQRQSSTMIDDISDILLEQFTGPKGERMRLAYTDFVCRQPAAMELYRELEKKRHKFIRVMNMLYANKFCERRKLPDFYLLIAQRVAKYVELMKKLEKETEALKLKHLPRVKQSSEALQKLVIAVDQGVYEYNNRKELESIQNRLELPRATKNKKLKGLQTLDLTAQSRLLLKRGDANWQGHGKHLSEYLI